MSKQFPRIYSLSTVGIQHHFHIDYIFHPFRTDFSGDSGIGKSMIADMLQLIFVGNQFQSATEGTGPRQVKTMPIGRYGYVFINVEIAFHQYIVLGMFISSAMINPDPFIIQGGYGKDAYIPIQNPISYRDILNDEIIEDIDTVSKRLDGQLNCQRLTQKSYHEYMMEHELLPIQITDKSRLRNYAHILRSFARGRDFKYDSESLKYFFFDDHKEIEIYEDFQQRLDNIEADLDGHKRHKETLAIVSAKQQDLIKLKSLAKEKHDAKVELYQAKAIYHFRNIQNKEEEILKNKQKIRESIISIATCKVRKYKEAVENIDTLLKEISIHLKTIEEAEELTEKVSNAEDVLNEKLDNILKECTKLNLADKIQSSNIIEYIEQLYRDLTIVESWVDKYQTIEDVKKIFYLQQINNEKRKKIKEFEDLLSSKKMTDTFHAFGWILENDDIEHVFQQKIETINIEIKKQQALSKFADINNQYSLSSWALRNGKALTIEQESVLVHFMDLTTQKPDLFENGVKYLPTPEDLFNSLITIENTDKGFWLNLNGIHEYVPLHKPQFFDTEDIRQLESYFTKNYDKSKSEIERLENELRILVNLKSILYKVGNETLNVYKDKKEIRSFQVDNNLEKSESEFERLCTNYFFEVEIKKWKSDIDESSKIIQEANQTKEYIDREIKNIAVFISKNKLQADHNFEDLRKELSNLSKNKNTEKQNYLYQQQQYTKLIKPKLNNISDESIEYSRRHIAKQNIQRIKQELINDKFHYDDSIIRYETLTKEKLIINLSTYENKYINPNEIELEFEKKEERYRIQYDNIVEKYVYINSQNRFKGSDDFIALAKEILPEILAHRIINDEVDVLQQIQDYLTEITEKYTEFSDVKLNILKDIFSQVQDKSIEYLTEIADISNYFSRNDCQISQGVSLKLNFSYSDSYPLDWIRNFEIKLEDEVINTGLFASLREKVSVEEMMKEAYIQCGGKARKIEIKHLLNPKSYFNIDFSMRKSDGSINSGSTGQTYSAIALLCIARLSLIEKGASSGRKVKGLRFMPIDETENIGSNFDMLEKIAQDHDYQLIVISRHPLDDYSEKGRYQYMLNGQVDGERIGTFAIFNEGEDAIEYTIAKSNLQ